MTKRIPSIALAVCLTTLSSFGMQAAQANQQCRADMPSKPRGWWSYRLIDGRKCWYEGKPMLSKSLLAWPTKGLAQANSIREVRNVKEKPGDPLEAQAWAPKEQDSFEARWQARIKQD